MNPKVFMIVFMIILAMMLLAAPKDLKKSSYTVTKGDEIVIITELQSAECSRTQILVESLLRKMYKEDSYNVTCTVIDK